MDDDGKLSGTDLIHGDSDVPYFKGPGATVAPSISVSTSMSTFDLVYAGSVPIPSYRLELFILSAYQSPAPDDNVIHASEIDQRNPERHIYSRYTQEASSRAEHVLSKVLVRCSLC